MFNIPNGIYIIDWDEFEGATEFFKFPPEFEVDQKYIQQIQISHNFISSIMVQEYGKVNAITYYNEEHQKTIALFLSRIEDGQDYYEIVKQLDEVLLKKIPQEEIIEEIKNIYNLSFSVYRVREEVMLKLANEVSNLKGIEHDYEKRVERIMNLSRNTKTRILLTLCLNPIISRKELYKLVNLGKKITFNNAIKQLIEQGLIYEDEKKNLFINF